MTSNEKLLATGYLLARYYVRSVWGEPNPHAFPFDTLARWMPNVTEGETKTIVAAFAHYVLEKGDIPTVRLEQMREVSREVDKLSVLEIPGTES